MREYWVPYDVGVERYLLLEIPKFQDQKLPTTKMPVWPSDDNLTAQRKQMEKFGADQHWMLIAPLPLSS